ncbi:ECF-type sigma factor [Streptomyces sp. T-3]|nr:ECF-type sigma factor [Streptomyces sp. T-3]
MQEWQPEQRDSPVEQGGESYPPQELRDRIVANGYHTLLKQIRLQEIYERCRAVGWPVDPTFDELEVLQRSSDERCALAGDTLVKVLVNQHKVWPTWDARKGAALETYFVKALILHFPAAFRHWQSTRRELPVPPADVTDLAASKALHADLAIHVLAHDALEGALRIAGPQAQAVVALFAVGYECREIAERLQISERAVEGRLYRFRQQIRTEPAGQDLNDLIRAQASSHVPLALALVQRP